MLEPEGLLLDAVESKSKGSTPSDSSFSFSLAPGHYVVHVERTGFVERDFPVDVPVGDEIVLALESVGREPK